jgi:23S rRNA-/tRNA-specific pseudouridylate synthase
VIPVLWSGDGLVAVDKPSGVTVIPGRSEAGDPPLRARLEAQLGRPLWVVHRLDRDTSGVLLFALDAATHRAASLALERGLAEKRYLALVSPPRRAAARGRGAGSRPPRPDAVAGAGRTGSRR